MADETKPLDAGWLYSPRYWPETRKPWQPKRGQCRAGVSPSGGGSLFSSQCSSKAKVTRTVSHHGRVVEVEYCGRHDPVAVEAKRKERHAHWEAKWAASKAAAAERERLEALRSDALDAIKHIAHGHNDPRALAQSVLAKHGETL